MVSEPALNWRVLGLLNLYRVLVPLVLLSLYSLGGARGTGEEPHQCGGEAQPGACDETAWHPNAPGEFLFSARGP